MIIFKSRSVLYVANRFKAISTIVKKKKNPNCQPLCNNDMVKSFLLTKRSFNCNSVWFNNLVGQREQFKMKIICSEGIFSSSKWCKFLVLFSFHQFGKNVSYEYTMKLMLSESQTLHWKNFFAQYCKILTFKVIFLCQNCPNLSKQELCEIVPSFWKFWILLGAK